MIALDIHLNHASEAWEVIDEVCKALMAYDVGIPLVEVLQHPWVRICPAILVATKVSDNDADLCHTRGQPKQGKEENLLRVDLVAAGCAKKGVPPQEGQLLLHRLVKQTLKIEGRVKTTQLRPVEACHLQRCCVREVVNAEALCAQEL